MEALCLFCQWPVKNDRGSDRDTICLSCLGIIRNASSDAIIEVEQTIQERIDYWRETIKASPEAWDYLEFWHRKKRALDNFRKEDKREKTKHVKRHPLRKPSLRMVRPSNIRPGKKPSLERLDQWRATVS